MTTDPTTTAQADQMVATGIDLILQAADGIAEDLDAGTLWPPDELDQLTYGAAMGFPLLGAAGIVAAAVATDHPDSLWAYLVAVEVLNGPAVES